MFRHLNVFMVFYLLSFRFIRSISVHSCVKTKMIYGIVRTKLTKLLPPIVVCRLYANVGGIVQFSGVT